MRIFNTMTQQIEDFSVPDRHVKLYVCGVTPYDTAHLGHAFVFATFDTLVRVLRYEGYRVTYTQNITDIDDPLFEKAAQLGNITWDELARQETDRFVREMTAINVAIPDHFVRASDELPTMFDLIVKLLNNGIAYINDGWIYFNVTQDTAYATLANAAGLKGYDNLLATANQNGNDGSDPRKRDPLDFLLWRAAQPGEPSWDSPWGPGRPGWHIECSAMATHYLGPQIDIHGGGTDLIFPHHSSEIAQSEAATGVKPFVRYWMHVGMVALNGIKMSKSLGNLVIVHELLDRYTPDAIRIALASHHYRKAWEFFEQDMQHAQELAVLFRQVAEGESANGEPPSSSQTNRAIRLFHDALANDLDTPQALSAIEWLANSIRDGILPVEELPLARYQLRDMAGLLGLTLRHA
jgi:cysteinyl-tRNA synthetase